MTTATMTIGTRTMEPTPRPRRSLEELVDRLMDSLTFVEAPPPRAPLAVTTAVVSPAKPRRSLEELVDNLMATLTFREGPATAAAQPTPVVGVTEEPTPHSVTRAIHEARRLRQSGDLDEALQTLAGGDLAAAEPKQARWAYTEWRQLVKRRYSAASALVYSQGTGRAAALVPRGNGRLEVVAALGLRWQPGKLVSRRSLRGLRPLARGGASC